MNNMLNQEHDALDEQRYTIFKKWATAVGPEATAEDLRQLGLQLVDVTAWHARYLMEIAS